MLGSCLGKTSHCQVLWGDQGRLRGRAPCEPAYLCLFLSSNLPQPPGSQLFPACNFPCPPQLLPCHSVSLPQYLFIEIFFSRKSFSQPGLLISLDGTPTSALLGSDCRWRPGQTSLILPAEELHLEQGLGPLASHLKEAARGQDIDSCANCAIIVRRKRNWTGFLWPREVELNRKFLRGRKYVNRFGVHRIGRKIVSLSSPFWMGSTILGGSQGQAEWSKKQICSGQWWPILKSHHIRRGTTVLCQSWGFSCTAVHSRRDRQGHCHWVYLQVNRVTAVTMHSEPALRLQPAPSLHRILPVTSLHSSAYLASFSECPPNLS